MFLQVWVKISKIVPRAASFQPTEVLSVELCWTQTWAMNLMATDSIINLKGSRVLRWTKTRRNCRSQDKHRWQPSSNRASKITYRGCKTAPWKPQTVCNLEASNPPSLLIPPAETSQTVSATRMDGLPLEVLPRHRCCPALSRIRAIALAKARWGVVDLPSKKRRMKITAQQEHF